MSFFIRLVELTDTERRELENAPKIHSMIHQGLTLDEYRRLLHGEAVAIGMVAAARVSQARGLCTAATVERLERLVRRAGLPTAMPDDITAPALALAMQTDKKTAAGRIRFVCVEAIGRTRLVELSAQQLADQL